MKRYIFICVATYALLLAICSFPAAAKNTYPEAADSVQVFIDEAVPLEKGARTWAATPLANLRRFATTKHQARTSARQTRRAVKSPRPSFARTPATVMQGMPGGFAEGAASGDTEASSASRISALRSGMDEIIRARVIEKMNEGRRRTPVDAAGSEVDAAGFAGSIPLEPSMLPPGQKNTGNAKASGPAPATLTAPQLLGSRAGGRRSGAGYDAALARCADKATAWTRSCADMGYPDEFTGEVRGETRIMCKAGEKRDIWLSNSCAPPQPEQTQDVSPQVAPVAKADGPENSDDAKPMPIALARAEKTIPEAKPAVAAAVRARRQTDTFGADLPDAAPSIPVDSIPLTPAVISAGPRNASLVSMCGAVADTAAVAAPVEGLCVRGTASKVTGDGPWTWTCSEAARTEKCVTRAPLLAVCGPMDGQKLKEVPMHGLCNSGAPSPVRGEGPWHWTCEGGPGSTRVMCSAEPEADQKASDQKNDQAENSTPRQEEKTVAPVKSAKAAKKAAGKSKSPVRKRVTTEAAAGKQAEEAATKNIDGICGDAVVPPQAAMPERDLCHAGIAEQMSGTGPWTWVCRGKGTGLNVTCIAQAQVQGRLPSAVDGVCGAAAKAEASIMPSKELCAAGVASQVNGTGPWAWSCGGINGGSAATCMTQAAAQSHVPELMPQAPKDLPPPPPMEALPEHGRISGSNDIGPGADDYTPEPPVRAPSATKTRESAARLVDGDHASIRFDSSSENVPAESMAVIAALGQRLAENPEGHVTVTAYADLQAAGNDAREARRLSLARALAVRDILIINGATDGQVKIRARGANVSKGNPDRVDFTDK